jgi:hypothetical protein
VENTVVTPADGVGTGGNQGWDQNDFCRWQIDIQQSRTCDLVSRDKKVTSARCWSATLLSSHFYTSTPHKLTYLTLRGHTLLIEVHPMHCLWCSNSLNLKKLVGNKAKNELHVAAHVSRETNFPYSRDTQVQVPMIGIKKIQPGPKRETGEKRRPLLL